MKKEFNQEKSVKKALDKEFGKKEFNLSEKIEKLREHNQTEFNAIKVRNIKEFIRLRNRLDMMLRDREISWEVYIERRNELAGEELVK